MPIRHNLQLAMFDTCDRACSYDTTEESALRGTVRIAARLFVAWRLSGLDSLAMGDGRC